MIRALTFLMVVTCGLSTVLAAAEYPTRPVQVVVPYAPGGSTDVLGRLMAERLEAKFKQPFVIYNRAGAGSVTGTEAVKRAEPDGYTILLASSAHTVNPVINSKVSYDPLKDFQPISLLVTIPHVLVVSPTLPVRSVADLVEHARKFPGTVTYGSAGIGTSNQLEAALLARMAGVEMVHVPYRGIGPALTDLMAGRLDVIVGSLASMMPTASAGGVRALAVTSRARVPSAPELPTIDESGLKGFVTVDWLGFLVHAKTDPAIVRTLSHAVMEIMKEPDFQKRLDELGFVVAASSPEEFRLVLTDDVWSRTARQLDIRLGD